MAQGSSVEEPKPMFIQMLAFQRQNEEIDQKLHCPTSGHANHIPDELHKEKHFQGLGRTNFWALGNITGVVKLLLPNSCFSLFMFLYWTWACMKYREVDQEDAIPNCASYPVHPSFGMMEKRCNMTPKCMTFFHGNVEVPEASRSYIASIFFAAEVS